MATEKREKKRSRSITEREFSRMPGSSLTGWYSASNLPDDRKPNKLVSKKGGENRRRICLRHGIAELARSLCRRRDRRKGEYLTSPVCRHASGNVTANFVVKIAKHLFDLQDGAGPAHPNRQRAILRDRRDDCFCDAADDSTSAQRTQRRAEVGRRRSLHGRYGIRFQKINRRRTTSFRNEYSHDEHGHRRVV